MATQVDIFSTRATNNSHYHCNYILTLSQIYEQIYETTPAPSNLTYNLNKSGYSYTTLYNYVMTSFSGSYSYYKLLVNDDSKIREFNDTLSSYDSSSNTLNYKIFYNGNGSNNTNKILTVGSMYCYENPCHIIHPLSTLKIEYGNDVGMYQFNGSQLKIMKNNNNGFGFTGPSGSNSTLQNCTAYSTSNNVLNYGSTITSKTFYCANQFTITRDLYIWNSTDSIKFDLMLNLVLNYLGDANNSPFTNYYNGTSPTTILSNGLKILKIKIDSYTLSSTNSSITININTIKSKLSTKNYCYMIFSNRDSELLKLNQDSYYYNACSVVTKLKNFQRKYYRGPTPDPTIEYDTLPFPELILFRGTGSSYSQINKIYGLGYITINNIEYDYSANSQNITQNKYSYLPYPVSLIERFGNVCTFNDRSDFTTATSFFKNTSNGNTHILTGANNSSYYCTAGGVTYLKLSYSQ